jgi:hypothetical protein
LLAACSSDRSDHVLDFDALGTEVSVTLFDTDSNDADEAARQLQDYLAGIGIDWYPWSPGELRAINIAIELQEAIEVSGSYRGIAAAGHDHQARSTNRTAHE